MADGFCKIDYLAVKRQNCKENKRVAKKTVCLCYCKGL